MTTQAAYIGPSSCPAITATSSEFHRDCYRFKLFNKVVDSFELPMKPIPPEKPKRTISMLSLKVHVDKVDYQNMDADRNVDGSGNVEGVDKK